jgi:hypothetical protein
MQCNAAGSAECQELGRTPLAVLVQLSVLIMAALAVHAAAGTLLTNVHNLNMSATGKTLIPSLLLPLLDWLVCKAHQPVSVQQHCHLPHGSACICYT